MNTPYEERVEYGIWRKRTGGYYAKVSVKGVQTKHPVDTLEEARLVRDQVVAEREALVGRRRPRRRERFAYTADRLPLIHQPQEGDPVTTEEREPIELSEPLRLARDQLAAQRDKMEEEAAPLRDRLANLDSSIERVQQAIDALEGREPDAAAPFRAPGALADRLNDKQRAPFSSSVASNRRNMLTRAQSEELRARILETLERGESNAMNRQSLTRLVATRVDFQINRDKVSAQVKRLIDAGLAVRNHPENPKDTVYWLPEDPEPES